MAKGNNKRHSELHGERVSTHISFLNSE